MKYKLLFFALFINIFLIYGQEEEKIYNQIWFDYNTRFSIDSIQNISGFVGYRTVNNNIFENFVVATRYNIKNNKSLKFLNLFKSEKPLFESFHLGARIHYIKNKNNSDNIEFRTMQGTKFFIPLFKKFPILNYIRLEERFQKTLDDSKWEVGFRFRYQISTILDWNKFIYKISKGLYFPLDVEFFLNIKKADRFNDVIRITPGIGYVLNDEWKFEFYTSYHNTLNAVIESESSNTIVFRLRIYNFSSTTKKESKNKEDVFIELID